MGNRSSQPAVSSVSQLWGDAHGQAVPVGKCEAKIPPDLLRYLMSDPLFEATQEELEQRVDFSRCVDYPDIPEHIYYEGYFHGLRTASAQWSLNPRKGYEFHKPAASLKLRAFLEALRLCNKEWLQRMAESLPRDNSSSDAIRAMLAAGKAFSDCAVQVHCGAEVSGGSLGWHYDAPNSFLHMALAIRGRRALHSQRWSARPTQEGLPREEVVEWQEPGDIYITSPTVMEHSVEYPSASWEERVVAVQCRFLMTSDELESFHQVGDVSKEWDQIMRVLAPMIQGSSLEVPTLERVQAIQEEMVAAGEGEPEKDNQSGRPSDEAMAPSDEAMAAMAKANGLEAQGDIAGAKEWIAEAGRLGHNFLSEYGGWK